MLERRPPLLVGRGEELDRFRAMCDGLPTGGGRVLLLEGEAGVGKSRLMEEALGHARRYGFDVRAGAARELEDDRPFGAIADVLGLHPTADDPERAAIGRSLHGDPLEDLRSLPTLVPELRFRIVEAIVGQVERLAVDTPVVLAVDDLQWADPASVLALHQVARRLTDLPVMLVAAFRPVPRPDHLERALAAMLGGGAAHVVLAPLDGEAVAELTRTLTGSAPSAELLRLVAGAGGNPFYVTELLAALEQEATLEPGHSSASPSSLPPTLRLTVLRRLGVLSRPALDLLRVAAVLGSEFSPPDLAIVMGRRPSELLPILAEALQAGVLTESDERLAFRHDLVRESVYADLPVALRKTLHLQAGRELATAGADSVRVATQLALGAEPGDIEPITWLRRAAREVAPRSPAIAVALLRRGGELAEPPRGGGVALPQPARRELFTQLRSELIWALLWAGETEEAERLARGALERLTEPEARGTLRYVLAKGLLAQGRIRESADELDKGLSEPGLPSTIRARLLADLALRRMHLRELEAGRVAAEQALREATEGTPDAFATCAASAALTVMHLYRGEVGAAEVTSRRALIIADDDPTGEAHLVGPVMYAALQAADADRLDDAVGMLGDWQTEAKGQLFSPTALILAGLNRFRAGRWDQAVADCETGLALSAELGSPVFDVLAHAVLAQIALARGEPARAEAAVIAGESEAGGAPTRLGLPALRWAQALLADARGEGPETLDVLHRTWKELAAADALGECPALAPDLVRLLLAQGDVASATQVTLDLERLGARMATDTAAGRALRCRGLVDADPDVLLEAIAAYERGPREVERAAACEDAAVHLAEAGRTAEAMAQVDQALAVYEPAGAVRRAARAEAILRTRGIRRRRHSRGVRATSGWESLTPTEEEVVRLTAQGLTNRKISAHLFISPRTVGTHLSHVFAKLGVATRAELAAAAARRRVEN